MEYKRLLFEVAKQKENENLWEFENRLHFLQKQAKINDDARFVETYKKGVFNNKLRETLMLRDPPINTRAELKRALTIMQVAMLKYAKTFNTPPTTITAGLGSMPKDDLEMRRKTNKEIMDAMRKYQFKFGRPRA